MKTRYIALFMSIVLLIYGCDLDKFDQQFNAQIGSSNTALDQSIDDMDKSLNEAMDKLAKFELPNPLEGWEMPKLPDNPMQPRQGALEFVYDFDGSIPGEYQEIIRSAGDFWSERIGTSGAIAISVSSQNDSEDPWLAAAKPTSIGENGLPDAGRVIINTSFAFNLEKAPDYFRSVVAHELGHVLGIGTLWQPKGLVDAGAALYVADSASGQVYGGAVPVQPQVLAHWDEQVLGDELMTPFATGSMYLGDISLATLKDIGWQVR